MKRIIQAVLVFVFAFGLAAPAFASDWDVAGKVLTGIEGLRILTAGKIDIIGNVAGINRAEREVIHETGHRTYAHRKNCRRKWIPHYVWEKKWVPEHSEYSPEFGEIIVEGHYVKYKAQRGGHWDYDCSCGLGD